MVTFSIQEVVLDCADPARLAEFWGRLLERRWGLLDGSWGVVGTSPLLGFQKVPEPKSSPKNRVHLDIEVDDVAAAVERAVGLGARTLGEPHYSDGGGFQVMLDPEENEFCFVFDPGGEWRATLERSLAESPG